MTDKLSFGILVFPGSNCDHDCYHVLKHVLGQEARFVWHKDSSLSGLDAVVVPGGFSYGDYLRTGAIARFSPIMRALERFAADGRPVIGICNGFQILLEAGLLPGAMLRNRSLKFVCRHVHIRVESTDTPFTNRCRPGQVLRIPVAHMEGNYFADEATLARLKDAVRVAFRYCRPGGKVADDANPNGSLDAIAGLVNEAGNVLGMMPHPERASESILGSEDGRVIFESMIEWMKDPSLKNPSPRPSPREAGRGGLGSDSPPYKAGRGGLKGDSPREAGRGGAGNG
jgi:phosphoribosylformylglycinamidine synthase